MGQFSTMGTSISMLQNQQQNNLHDYNNITNPNTYHSNQIGYYKNVPDINSENYDSQSRNSHKSSSNKSSSNHSNINKLSLMNPNISSLVSDINKSLDDYAPSISKNNIDSEEEEEEEKEKDQEDDSEKWLSKTPTWLKEILLFIIIYFIFSLGFVKKSVGTYIKYINPDSEGNVSFVGIIIYGLLLISTYMIIKYFFIKN